MSEQPPEDAIPLQEAVRLSGKGESTLRRWKGKRLLTFYKGAAPPRGGPRPTLLSYAQLKEQMELRGYTFPVEGAEPPTTTPPPLRHHSTNHSAITPPPSHHYSVTTPPSQDEEETTPPPLHHSTIGTPSPNHHPSGDSTSTPPPNHHHSIAPPPDGALVYDRAASLEHRVQQLAGYVRDLEEELAATEEQNQKLSEQNYRLSVRLEYQQESSQDTVKLLTDAITEKAREQATAEQQANALQLRANTETTILRQESTLLSERVEELKASHEFMTGAQQALSSQYEERIKELRQNHARELELAKEGRQLQTGVLQTKVDALLQALERSQAETDRLVAQGAERDRRLAQQEAELAAYRAWAAKGGLGRMLSRPEVPTAPRGLLPGSDTE